MMFSEFIHVSRESSGTYLFLCVNFTMDWVLKYYETINFIGSTNSLMIKENLLVLTSEIISV